jgi:hypothetical protein
MNQDFFSPISLSVRERCRLGRSDAAEKPARNGAVIGRHVRAGDETSHVFRAMDVAESLARAPLRFAVGRLPTEAEVDFAAESVGLPMKRLKVGASS